MINPRPSPKKLAALQLEIKQRYSRKARKAGHYNRSRGIASIRLIELTKWLDDLNGAGTELDATEPNFAIVRIFAHHFAVLREAPRRITAWIETYAPWVSLRNRERLIREVTDCPIKWTADKLAWKIRLDDATRSRLKIKTIGAFDISRDQRKARRKLKQAEYDRQRRPRKRQPVGKPWTAQGISKATWYRRQARET